MKKVIAIASVGGHWIQLLRITPAFANNELVFISTKNSFAEMVPNHRFYAVPDSNRKNKLGLFISFYRIANIIRREKPDLVVTTGAAPGLMGILAGKIIGAKTVWVDSIANVDEVSLSGKIAIKLATKVYTQWPNLASNNVHYSGNVLS